MRPGRVLPDGEFGVGLGQRQMFNFALIMPAEPGAGLSVEETAQISAATVELHEGLDATAIVIKHDMQVVEKPSVRSWCCTRVGCSRAGKWRR